MGGMSTEQGAEKVQVPEHFQYLRPAQVEELQQESNALGEGLRTKLPTGLDKRDMARRKRQIDKMLADQQPPDLNPTERDAFAREARRLESEFTVGMLSAEEMRKNPPGAVDRNLAWHMRHRRTVARWKNIQRALHKGDPSPDLANIERFRPHRMPTDPSMAGAQIPGRLFVGTNPSPEYRENYDRIFGNEDTEQGEAKAAKPEKPEAKPGKTKRDLEHLKIEMLCGKRIDRRGRKWHEDSCAACKRLAALKAENEAIAAETTGATEAAEGSPSAE